MKGKKIAVVLVDYPLGVSPMIINTVKMFSASGFEVDILIDEKTFHASPINFNDGRIDVILCRSLPQRKENLVTWAIWRMIEEFGKHLVFHFYHRLFGSSISLQKYLGILNPKLFMFSKSLIEHISGNSYGLLIGVDLKGLLTASLASHQFNIPVVYYNMELFQYKNCRNRMDLLAKSLEVKSSQKCLFTVIQDKQRGEVLRSQNDISEDVIRYLPVASCGPPVIEKGQYFRKKFNISKNQVIVIYAGNLVEWSMCYEIAQSVPNWPEQCVLVLHTWRRDIENTWYFKKIVKDSDPIRVFFSVTPLEYEDLPAALSSADVGIVFYKPVDENFTEIGSSSNKIAQYVQAGLPIIANDLPSVRAILYKFGSGICVPGPDHIGSALREVLKNYESYRKGAFQSYEEHYNFTKYFSPIISELKNEIED